MGNYTSRKDHPQPTLVPFYTIMRIYLTYEALLGILWFVHMIVIKYTMGTLNGAQFRASNEANLFHFTAAISMWAVVQQTYNDNGVSWWAIIPIFVSLGRDFSSILNIAHGHFVKIPGLETAWNSALAENILHLVGSVSAFLIYFFVFIVIRPKDLPTPVAFRKKKRRNDADTPLLLDDNDKML